MIYDPDINKLASLPIEMLVQPVSDAVEGQVACRCPFCKSETPHFIIYKRKHGGLYSKDAKAERWMCTRTQKSGYGAIELYAAMTGRGSWWRRSESSPQSFLCVGEDLRHVCLELQERCLDDGNKTKEQIREEIGKTWPALLQRDYRTVADRPQSMVSYVPKADFSVQDLSALGCVVWLDYDGVVHYGFDTENQASPWRFQSVQISEDFKVYALSKVILPAVNRRGEDVSEVIHSTPWNPLFLCLTENEPLSNEDFASFRPSGSIFRPAMDAPPMVFSNSDEHTHAKVRRWLAGDKVFTRAVEYRTTDTTGVSRAIKELEPTEPTTATALQWESVTKGKDQDKQVMEQQEVEIPESERKTKAVIYCTTAQDAISAYYHLKALRHTYPGQFGGRWYHVCWPFGDVPFSSVHYNKLFRFAESLYTLFPSETEAELRARDISCRYRDILRAALPEKMSDKSHLFMSRIYCHPVNSVRDFFLAYQMSHKEAYQNDDDLNRLFSSCITSALSSMPFERKEKRDKNGFVKEVYYTINPATLWEFMASAGYARDVRSGEPNKIGRYVHVDGPFADELDAPSMVQATVNNLIAYARQLNDARPDMPDEYELMVQAVRRANKEINEKAIASLPVIDLNYMGGYGAKVDHFFYENGALRITPDSITMVPYDQVKFNVERGELMPWNVTLAKNEPFTITENPEYQQRKKRITEKREQKDDLGKPLYTLSQLAQEENDLAIWAQSHRWIVDWKGKPECDMWPTLRVMRGFANEEWDKEQNLIHDGKKFSSEEQMELDCRFANLLFCLGRALWRFRESKSNCISYLMENEVTMENRAEGGSGKSTFVYIFAGCAAHILNVDCRDLAMGKELAANLANYRHRSHRVIHWEDTQQSFNIANLYNFVTGGFSVKSLYHDRVSIPLSESPGHVVSSNYPISDLADSTMRRVCIGGFSHRFAGQNTMKNKAARYISDIMPDFNATNPERLSPASRNQIAMICALAVQFVMRYDEKVDAQKKYMESRALSQSLGDSFLRFARVFFSQDHIWGTPQDLDSMLEEYKTVYAEASKNKSDSFSPKAFKRRVLDYCETAGIVMNPEQLFTRADGKSLKKAAETGYFAHQAWCTRRYFVGRDWEDDVTISPKQIRELMRTEHAVYFYRKGKDYIPANNDELMGVYQQFVNTPDPAPIVDDTGKIVVLTDEEKERWRNYLDAKQRKRSAPAPAQASLSSPQQEEDLPF